MKLKLFLILITNIISYGLFGADETLSAVYTESNGNQYYVTSPSYFSFQAPCSKLLFKVEYKTPSGLMGFAALQAIHIPFQEIPDAFLHLTGSKR